MSTPASPIPPGTRIVKVRSEQRAYVGRRSRGLLGFVVGLPVMLVCFVLMIATWGSSEGMGRLFFVAGLAAFAWFIVSIVRMLAFLLSGDRDMVVTRPEVHEVVQD